MKDDAAIGNSSTTTNATNAGGGGLRVLLVDDHVESVLSVGRLLRSQGYQVRAALSGIEAVSAAVDFLPDVALIDLSLPLLDGFAVARKLRSMSSTRATFLVALTVLLTWPQALYLGAKVANDHAPSQCRFLVNGEPTENRVALASKGTLRVEVVARGKMAHSAYPELGESAIDKLLTALARLRAMPLPVDPQFGCGAS